MKKNQGISKVNLTSKSQSDVYSTFKQTNSTTSRMKEFLEDLSNVGQSSIILILLGLSLSIPITMVTIGSIFINDCPIEPVIPLWLLIFGSVACLSIVIAIINKIYERIKRLQNDKYKPSVLKNFKYVLDLFLFGFFIAGNVIVYQISDTVRLYDGSISSSNHMFDSYCNSICYLFAFWIIISLWIIFAFVMGFILLRFFTIFCRK